MEEFAEAYSVRLLAHTGRYLWADPDLKSVSQKKGKDTKGVIWRVELVPERGAIRLKSVHDLYLHASDYAFLLGATGKKVTQSYASKADSSLEWVPEKYTPYVKLKARSNKYLRANRGVPPYRNSVTHDLPVLQGNQHVVLWTVEVVRTKDAPSLQPSRLLTPRHSDATSSKSSSQHNQKEDSSDDEAPHFTPARGSTSRHKLKPTEIPPSAEPSSSSESLSPVSIRRTRAVRVDADSSPPPRWNPPVREDGSPLPPRRRTPPARQDDSPPLPHIRTPLAREDGDSPRPRSPNPRFLEANNSPPPHMKIPSTDDSDSPSPRIRPPTTLESSRNPPRRESSESSVRRSRFKPPDNDEENESSSRGRASFKTAEPKSANARRINYEVAEDDGEVLALEDGTFGTFMFEGSTVDELIEELRRKTKIDDIILCMRNNQKGTLFKMRLALPSNKAPLPVVVVRQNSSFGRKLSTR